jgi:hypothetical protein
MDLVCPFFVLSKAVKPGLAFNCMRVLAISI